MTRVEQVFLGIALVTSASPAFAGLAPVPAPAVGVGIGAILLIGAGYRAVKARIK
jgi:hypothetical protein